MSIFSNPLLSVAGLKERAKNVVDVLKISLNPFSKEKVVSSVGGPVGAALEFVANNPFTTAAIVQSAAAGTIKASVTKAVSSLSTTGKIVTGTVGTLTAGAAVTSPKVAETVIKTASAFTPESILGLGARVGEFIEDPNKDTGKNLLGQNPIALGTGVAIAGIVAGKTTSQVAKTYAELKTAESVQELGDVIEDYTKTKSKEIEPIKNTAPTITIPSGQTTNNIPQTNPTPTIPTIAPITNPSEIKAPVSKKVTRKKKSKPLNRIKLALALDVRNNRLGASVC